MKNVLAQRSSGILLAVSSLPSRYGIGDFGPAARAWIDFLAAAGQRWWQILPLGPPAAGNSPYQCYSAFAGNPAYVSPEDLLADGLIRKADLADAPPVQFACAQFEIVSNLKRRLLHAAWQNFLAGRAPALRESFEIFRQTEAAWLPDYALFMALMAKTGGKPWQQWPADIARRKKSALAAAREELSGEIQLIEFEQFLFARQLAALRTYAASRGICIMGDMPIYVALQSADVWARPELFKLDHAGNPKVVAGVPPDAFSATGQCWGNPIYHWRAMAKDGYAWWLARIAAALKQADVVRIDHFRGLESAWEIPAGAPDARTGRWVKVPGRQLLEQVQKTFGPHLPLVAEDLGIITPEVTALRDAFDLPGMRVLQFAFDSNSESPHLPHNFSGPCIVYTGTHDNNTTVGWYKALSRQHKKRVQTYLPEIARDPAWQLMRAAWASTASIAIAPFQDVLRLDERARMNSPGVACGNWGWRAPDVQTWRAHVAPLRKLTQLYARK